MYVCMCMSLYVHVKSRGQQLVSSLMALSQQKRNSVSRRAWGSSVWLGFWTSKASVFSLVCHYAWLFTWVFGLRLRSPCLPSKPFTDWAIFPAPYHLSEILYLFSMCMCMSTCVCAWTHLYAVPVKPRTKGQLVALSFPHLLCVPGMETAIISSVERPLPSHQPPPPPPPPSSLLTPFFYL